MVAMSIIPVACAMLMLGAWMVLPFAGVEMVLLWVAFRVIGQHDADYEALMVAGGEFRWERRYGDCTEAMHGNLEWAQILGARTER